MRTPLFKHFSGPYDDDDDDGNGRQEGSDNKSTGVNLSVSIDYQTTMLGPFSMEIQAIGGRLIALKSLKIVVKSFKGRL